MGSSTGSSTWLPGSLTACAPQDGPNVRTLPLYPGYTSLPRSAAWKAGPRGTEQVTTRAAGSTKEEPSRQTVSHTQAQGTGSQESAWCLCYHAPFHRGDAQVPAEGRDLLEPQWVRAAAGGTPTPPGHREPRVLLPEVQGQEHPDVAGTEHRGQPGPDLATLAAYAPDFSKKILFLKKS